MLSEYLSLTYCMIFKTNYSPFLEKIICRCNLPCWGGGHFHCPFCDTTIIRKDTIMPHLMQCKNKCDMVQLTSAPPPPPPSPETHPTVLSSLSFEHSYTLPPSVSAVKMDHSYPQPASHWGYATNAFEVPALPSGFVQEEFVFTHQKKTCPSKRYNSPITPTKYIRWQKKQSLCRPENIQRIQYSSSCAAQDMGTATGNQMWDGGLPAIPPAGTAKWPFSQLVPSHQIIRLL